MIEICCQSDLDKFRQNKEYPAVFGDYLQSRFLELKRCMGEFFEGEGEFNLEEFGPLYICQRSDDLRNLSKVGLSDSIFEDIPEEVSLIQAPGFSFIEVQTAFNNEFLPHFYLPKGEFEAIYPEFQDYLKRWEPTVKVFKPHGEWKPEKKQKYSFDGPKYKTQGVDQNVPERLQSTIWSFIATRKNTGNPPLDYLQVFNLRSENVGSVKMQIIECIQEQPEHIQTFSFPFELAMEEKIFVIDDVDHVTMLLAREY